MDAWETNYLFPFWGLLGWPIFRGKLAVSFREGRSTNTSNNLSTEVCWNTLAGAESKCKATETSMDMEDDEGPLDSLNRLILGKLHATLPPTIMEVENGSLQDEFSFTIGPFSTSMIMGGRIIPKPERSGHVGGIPLLNHHLG